MIVVLAFTGLLLTLVHPIVSVMSTPAETVDGTVAQAIKLPGGAMISDGARVTKDFSKLNKYEVTERGSKVAILGLGTFYGLAKETAALLKEKADITATVINPYYITGLDEELLTELKKDHDVVITI